MNVRSEGKLFDGFCLCVSLDWIFLSTVYYRAYQSFVFWKKIASFSVLEKKVKINTDFFWKKDTLCACSYNASLIRCFESTIHWLFKHSWNWKRVRFSSIQRCYLKNIKTMFLIKQHGFDLFAIKINKSVEPPMKNQYTYNFFRDEDEPDET